jgi:hypothetical protein
MAPKPRANGRGSRIQSEVNIGRVGGRPKITRSTRLSEEDTSDEEEEVDEVVPTESVVVSEVRGGSQTTATGGISFVSSLGANDDGLDGVSVVTQGGAKSVRSRSFQGVSVALFTKQLFARKKFVLSDTELEFSCENKNSICYQCLTALHLKVDKSSRMFWEEHKHVVTQELSNKRSNVAYSMRKEWMSE